MNMNKILANADHEDLDLRLKTPFTMLVSGPSSSGKTTFCRRLLENRHSIFTKASGKVFWFYKVYQPIYTSMLQLGVVDEFEEGMCSMEWLAEHRNSTIVVDDQALDVSEDTSKIFSVGSHHYNVNVIFICQNLFTKNRHFRDISLNSTYHVIFKNPRDKSTISHFARQFAPGKSQDLIRIYNEASEQPHSYLFVDYHQQTPDNVRMRANLFCENKQIPIQIFRLSP